MNQVVKRNLGTSSDLKKKIKKVFIENMGLSLEIKFYKKIIERASSYLIIDKDNEKIAFPKKSIKIIYA